MIKYLIFIISITFTYAIGIFEDSTEIIPTDEFYTLECINLSMSKEGFKLEDPCAPGGTANKCCPYWDIEVSTGWPWPTITCTTGGAFKCEDCSPDAGSGGSCDDSSCLPDEDCEPCDDT